MGQLFAPRAFGSKKCVVRTFVVRPDGHSFIHSCFSFSSAEASRNLGFLRGKTKKNKKKHPTSESNLGFQSAREMLARFSRGFIHAPGIPIESKPWLACGR